MKNKAALPWQTGKEMSKTNFQTSSDHHTTSSLYLLQAVQNSMCKHHLQNHPESWYDIPEVYISV
jgi:hypothetical protein